MDYRKITNDRQFKDVTGHSKADFLALLSDFEATFFSQHGQNYEAYIEENVTEPPKLKTLGDALFFILFQMKNDLLWGSLAFVFGIARSTAHDNFKHFSILLEATLTQKGVMPKRAFENVEEFEEHLSEAKELLFDGTENSVERPKGDDNQRSKYSGKKHMHTDIALILSNKDTYIYYVSKLYEGSNVDFGIFKKEFPPDEGWFKNFKVVVDLGFVGIDKLYEIKELVIGVKRSRKSKKNPNPKLSEEQKEHNKAVSKERIFVEHAIGKLKRFRMLKNRSRLKSNELKDRIIGICAGLWNYRLTFR